MFAYSSVDGQLGCFLLLAVGNQAAMNMGVHISVEFLLSILLGTSPEVRLPGHMVILC